MRHSFRFDRDLMELGSSGAQPELATIMPLCATDKEKAGTWRIACVQTNVISIQGGYSSVPSTATVVQTTQDGIVDTFVELDKNASWFVKGVGGTGVKKGDLKSVDVLSVIRRCFHDTDEPDITGTEPSGDVDPMLDLEDFAPADKETKRGKQKKGACKSTIKTIKVPRRPPCTNASPDDLIEISVYQKSNPNANGKKFHQNNRNLYIHMDGLDWLLSYAADEYDCQGVKTPLDSPPQIASDSQGSDSQQAMQAGYELQYDVTDKSWRAEILAGPYKGETKAMPVADLTTALYDKLRPDGLAFSHIDRLTKKEVVMEYLNMWITAVRSNQVDAFEDAFGQEELYETPKKKRRSGEAEPHDKSMD